jgi:hypothetical protein
LRRDGGEHQALLRRRQIGASGGGNASRAAKAAQAQSAAA